MLKEDNSKKRKIDDIEESESTDSEFHGSSRESESEFENGEDLPSTAECQAGATSSTPPNAISVKLKVSDIVSPALSAVLDRTNTSNRKAAFIIGSASSSSNNIANVPVSVSSVRRARIKARSTFTTTVKTKL